MLTVPIRPVALSANVRKGSKAMGKLVKMSMNAKIAKLSRPQFS